MITTTLLTATAAETIFVKVAAGGTLILFGRRIWLDRYEWFDRMASNWRRALHPEREEIIPEYDTSSYGRYAQRFMVDSFGYDWESNSTTIAILKRFNPRAYDYFRGLEISLEDLKNLNVEVKAYDTAAVVSKLQKTTEERDSGLSTIAHKDIEIARMADTIEQQQETIERQASEIIDLKIWKREKEALIKRMEVELEAGGTGLNIVEQSKGDTRKKNPADNLGKKNKQLSIVIAGNALGWTVSDCMRRLNMSRAESVKAYYREAKQTHLFESILKEMADSTWKRGEIIGPGEEMVRAWSEWSEFESWSLALSLFNDAEKERVFNWFYERRQDDTIRILPYLSEDEGTSN